MFDMRLTFFFSFNNAPAIKKIEFAYDIYLSHRLGGNALLSPLEVFSLFFCPLFSQWWIALSDYLTFNGVITTSKGIAMNDKKVWHFLMNSDQRRHLKATSNKSENVVIFDEPISKFITAPSRRKRAARVGQVLLDAE